VPRHVGQQHHADGDADDGEAQLVDPVGVVEVRDGPSTGATHTVPMTMLICVTPAGDDAGDAEA
jgi:hypothetical protein